ncbi:hypothetical protein CC78DRAFT_606185 [Lojkania enalia]|uniref:Uncharacterized protein n=1 Tax=Lojkania enalia TaxID=147567 RepID=A0A9P4K730_9PLEO|nr:hypothetical protein CC78DRAFT_606185 [Didymosphaeria enalia]
MALRTLRQIPDSSPTVHLAPSGNINDLKDLFRNRMTSPRDVSSIRGYSLLRLSPLRITAYLSTRMGLILPSGLFILISTILLSFKSLPAQIQIIGNSKPLSSHDNSLRNKAMIAYFKTGFPRRLQRQWEFYKNAYCVHFLLEAGADPDLKTPEGFRVNSSLDYTARNATDPMGLKNLLCFNADI